MCDGLIGAFHGGGGGEQKCMFCCTFCICAYLSALLSLDFILDFMKKKFFWLSGVVGGWLWYHFMGGVHWFADFDQVELLGVGGYFLG